MASILKRISPTIAPRVAASPRRYSSAFGYTQAKALVYSEYGAPKDVLRLHAHSIPPAYGQEITVKFLASPINPADINQIEGVYPSRPPLTLGLGTPAPSAVGGNEGVVEILSTGADVRDFRPGDRALLRHTGFGTWRTHATASSHNLLRIPDEFADAVPVLSAATVSVNPCTAYRMLRDFTPLREGDWVIQNGANSGVGRAVIQLARLWGIRSINVVRDRPDIDALKKELAELGADVVVTEEEMAAREFRERVKELTAGGGAKLALNCVGGKATTNMLKHVGSGGHVVTYGAMAKQPLTVPASALIFADVHFHGFWVSRWADTHPDEKERMLGDIFAYIQKGQFRDVPVEKTRWTPETKQETLLEAVEKSGKGFGGRKQVFVFEET